MQPQTWYLELSEQGTHKFYEVKLEDKTLTIRYGRIGDAGQSSVKTFDTPEKALAEAEKKLKEKRKGGYVDAILTVAATGRTHGSPLHHVFFVGTQCVAPAIHRYDFRTDPKAFNQIK
jgi:predicted DNA-binding WGR domain protein